MEKHPTLFITRRQLVHQQAALKAAPPELEVALRCNPPREEILALLPRQEFLIMEREGQVDAEMLTAGKDLRLVQWLGSQTWNIDLRTAKERGVAVCYTPVRSCVQVAEHIVMQVLMVLRHSPELLKIIQEPAPGGKQPALCTENSFAVNWMDYKKVQLLWKKKFGILGFGEIGAEVARRLKGFDCQIYYYKRSRLPLDVEAELGLTYAPGDQLTKECDIVCSMLPLNPGTEQSLGDDFFAKLKPGAFFISCGGSGTVNEEAVIRALGSGRLSGAALDNFTWEPIQPSNPLLELGADPSRNLVLTPHVAAGTDASNRANDYENILRFLAGQPLQNQLA